MDFISWDLRAILIPSIRTNSKHISFFSSNNPHHFKKLASAGLKERNDMHINYYKKAAHFILEED